MWAATREGGVLRLLVWGTRQLVLTQVGDARFLPFRAGSVDVVFSYSVVQHFSKDDASREIKEVGRVLQAKR
jgi:ubiquinone/menaquinone biosynthesis C-methylase UbiE